MRFNVRTLGILLLYVFTLGVFGQSIAQLLLGLAQLVIGNWMHPETLMLVALCILGLVPLITALPFCLEFKDAETTKKD